MWVCECLRVCFCIIKRSFCFDIIYQRCPLKSREDVGEYECEKIHACAFEDKMCGVVVYMPGHSLALWGQITVADGTQ